MCATTDPASIRLLYDDGSVLPGFLGGFGFSLLVNDKILFDAGPDAEALLHNLYQAKIDPRAIKTSVYSHYHWDHTDACKKLSAKMDSPSVYCTPGTRRHFSCNIGTVIMQYGGKRPVALTKEVAISSELMGEYKGELMPEQVLYLRYHRKKVAVISGCAHFGIAKKLDFFANEVLHIFGETAVLDTVIGGFHWKNLLDEEIVATGKQLLTYGIKRVFPMHCTGEVGKQILAKLYGQHCIDVLVGERILL